MTRSTVLILRKTINGNRAEAIKRQDADHLVEQGEAIKLPDGIYKYMDKVGKVQTKETPSQKSKKKTYKTKILEAE